MHQHLFRLGLALAAALLILPAGCKKEPPKTVMTEVVKDPCQGPGALTEASCPGDGLSPDERELVELINKYRQDAGLPAIPVSPSLMRVANRHILDLAHNVGQLSHSWSNCAYQSGNLPTYPCMWGAPQRLKTKYTDTAEEIAYSLSNGATAEAAFAAWKGGPQSDAMLSKGSYGSKKWQAIGVAIYGQYALAWLGAAPDPAAQ